MIQQGPNNPNVVFEIASGNVVWSNINNVKASDDSYATCALTNGQFSRALRIRDFGFAIPAASTIVGILIEVERSSNVAAGVADFSVILTDEIGSPIGVDKAGGDWPTSDAYATYGSSSDLWSATLTPTLVNDTGFGLRFQAAAGATVTASVDHVRMTVSFREPHEGMFSSQAGNKKLNAGGMWQPDFVS